MKIMTASKKDGRISVFLKSKPFEAIENQEIGRRKSSVYSFWSSKNSHIQLDTWADRTGWKLSFIMRDTKHLKAMCHSDKNCLQGRETEWFGAVTYYQTIISSCQYQNLPWELRKIHSICSSRIFYSCKDCKMIFGYMESTLNLNRGIQIFVAEFLFLFVTVESRCGKNVLRFTITISGAVDSIHIPQVRTITSNWNHHADNLSRKEIGSNLFIFKIKKTHLT